MRFTPVRAGFTLIELLVVIAIIGLLASVILASLSTARVRGRDARRSGDMNSTIQALELYRLSNGGNIPPVSIGPDNNCAGAGSCLGDITSALVKTYIGAMPVDPAYADSVNNYRYCVSPAAQCTGGANKCYQLIRRDEEKGKWCTPSQFSLPTGSACWTTNGAPDDAAQNGTFEGWC